MNATKIDRIILSDGCHGVQTQYLQDDGTWSLHEIVIDREADGTRCRRVYSSRSYLEACVYGFSDLAGLTWSVVSESR